MADPKDFFTEKFIPSHCLVLRPFDDDSDHIWAVITKELSKNFSCKDVSEFKQAGLIMEQIFRAMAKADVIIVDLTGGNPNVFYELGIAHYTKGTNKVILLKQESSVVPFDVSGYRFLSYDPSEDGLQRLHPRLDEAVKSAAEQTFWFLLAEGQSHESQPFLGRDQLFYRFEVQAVAFAHQAVRLKLTIRSYPVGQMLPAEPVETTLAAGESFPMPLLPWHVRFEHMEKDDEKDKALLCVIPE